MSTSRLPDLTRRVFLRSVAGSAGVLLLPVLARSRALDLPNDTRTALGESPLVYISPLRSDGTESTCHGEVWFVTDGGDVVVCSDSDRWKSRAVKSGLDRARIWVGDFGVWTRSGGRFRSAPSFGARAAFETEEAATERALEAFGAKYTSEWGKWGPRFRNGLAEGSRVLIRYRPLEL